MDIDRPGACGSRVEESIDVHRKLDMCQQRRCFGEVSSLELVHADLLRYPSGHEHKGRFTHCIHTHLYFAHIYPQFVPDIDSGILVYHVMNSSRLIQGSSTERKLNRAIFLSEALKHGWKMSRVTIQASIARVCV